MLTCHHLYNFLNYVLVLMAHHTSQKLYSLQQPSEGPLLMESLFFKSGNHVVTRNVVVNTTIHKFPGDIEFFQWDDVIELRISGKNCSSCLVCVVVL